MDVIAHGIGDRAADEELFKLMKVKGTTYAPTLAVYEPRGRDILTPLLGAVLAPAARQDLVPPQDPPMRPADGSAENGDPRRVRRWAVLQNNTAALRKARNHFRRGHRRRRHRDAPWLGYVARIAIAGRGRSDPARSDHGGDRRRGAGDQGRRGTGTIAPGKLADLVLVEGEPYKDIRDVEKIKRVFLGGREIDREGLAREIAEPGWTPIPAIKARELIDDFESANGRSSIDTLWVNSTDSG